MVMMTILEKIKKIKFVRLDTSGLEQTENPKSDCYDCGAGMCSICKGEQ